MAKGKPRWKDLPFYERFAKQLKQHGVSDEMCEHIRERGKKTILFILMFFRIKGTPSALSKTLWQKRMFKSLAKNKENNNGEPISDAMYRAVIFTVFFMELFLIIFYIVLGNKIGTTEFIVMSALQVFTCLWSFGVNLSEVKTAFSCNIEDIKFHRFQFLFNVVLDYIYYPWAIYMLLK